MQKCIKTYGAGQGGWRGPAALKSGHTEIQMQKCIMIYGDGLCAPERSLGGYTHFSFKRCRFTKEKNRGGGLRNHSMCHHFIQHLVGSHQMMHECVKTTEVSACSISLVAMIQQVWFASFWNFNQKAPPSRCHKPQYLLEHTRGPKSGTFTPEGSTKQGPFSPLPCCGGTFRRKV